MRFDTSQEPKGYLYNVLTDGAKPFRYRSRVRTLLGIPENEEGSFALSTTLPPVGFRYVNYSFTDEPYSPLQRPSDEAIYSALDRESQTRLDPPQALLQQDIQANTSIEGHSIDLLRTVERSRDNTTKKEGLQDEASRKNTDQKSKSESSTKQEKMSEEAAERAEQSETDVERTRIKIPGISLRRQTFPALTVTKNRDASSSETNVDLRENSSPPLAGNTVDVSSEAVRNIPPELTPHTPLLPGEGDKRIETGDERMSPSLTKRRGLGDELKKHEEETGFHHVEGTFLKSKALEGRQGGVHNLSDPQTQTVKRNLIVSSSSRKLKNSATDDMNVSSISSSSNRNAAEKIEQLRHTVQELTSKVSAQQARTGSETPPPQAEQTPPPPVQQQVVVIRQSSERTRIPCAFWERSYLSRFHLRMLR